MAIEAAEELTEDPLEPLTNLSEVTDIPNSNAEQPSRLSGYHLKRGLLNEDEALEIILKGGSGFGTPKLGQSPRVTDSPKVGSHTSTDISHIRKPATLMERNLSSSPTTYLSESCPTSCQILSSSPQIKHQRDLTNHGRLMQSTEQIKEIPNLCENKINSISQCIIPATEEDKETPPSSTEFTNDLINDRHNQNQLNSDEHETQEQLLSSSDSEEEISIYQSGRNKKEYIKEPSDSAPGSFHLNKNTPVIPLISCDHAQDVMDAAKTSRIKPCDTISASDVEDDFTNIIVTGTFSPPLNLMSSVTSATSKEEVKKLPCLSGFIDSWKPFGRTQRFFDTPPENNSNDVPSFGFRFQRDVTVPGLNVANSQYMLQLFDYIETEKGKNINLSKKNSGKTLSPPFFICAFLTYSIFFIF